MMEPYRNRTEAGRELARQLTAYQGRPDVVVLALPRGGVPVAHQVAQALGAPLDLLLVRKLGVPGHEELAMGAIARDALVLNEEILEAYCVADAALARTIESEQAELQRRDRLYRGERPLPVVQGRTVILIDDGLATGSTMRAAVSALRQHRPARIVVAVPVGAEEACELLRELVDEVVCARTPEPFCGVGRWYEDFTQTTDREVRELLSGTTPRENTRGQGEWMES